MTDQTNNFNDSARACLEYYAAANPAKFDNYGYLPHRQDIDTDVYLSNGVLEWKAIDGQKMVRITMRGFCILEELRHKDTQAQLDAAHKRIQELNEAGEKQARDLSNLYNEHLELLSTPAGEWQQLVVKQNQRIAELEAVCREVVEAFEIQVKDDFYQHGNIEIVTGPDEYDFEYYANNGNPFHTALRRLLDTLPPSE